MMTPVDVQQHARQGTSRTPLAMYAALALPRHQSRPLQRRLHPGVTEIDPMLARVTSRESGGRSDRNTSPDINPAPSPPWPPAHVWGRVCPAGDQTTRHSQPSRTVHGFVADGGH